MLIAHHAVLCAEPEGPLTVFEHGPDEAQGTWQDVFTDAAKEAPIEAPGSIDPQLPGAILIDGGHGVCGGDAIVGEGAVLEAAQSLAGGADPDGPGAIFKNGIDLDGNQPLRFCVCRDGLLARAVQSVPEGSKPEIAFPVGIADLNYQPLRWLLRHQVAVHRIQVGEPETAVATDGRDLQGQLPVNELRLLAWKPVLHRVSLDHAPVLDFDQAIIEAEPDIALTILHRGLED